MKIETVTTYTFEPGDIVVDPFYFHAVIRTAQPTWKSTNGQIFSDVDMEKMVARGSFVYLGSQTDVAKDKF